MRLLGDLTPPSKGSKRKEPLREDHSTQSRSQRKEQGAKGCLVETRSSRVAQVLNAAFSTNLLSDARVHFLKYCFDYLDRALWAHIPCDCPCCRTRAGVAKI